MPVIFHRKPYEAKAGCPPDAAAFTTWEQLEEELDPLTPEQRCDAVYADWVLQLHSSAHQALLPPCNLRIGQRAIEFNGVAEITEATMSGKNRQQE